VVSGTNVIINWVAPVDGGSAITAYTVAIGHMDGSSYTAYAGCTGAAVSCTVRISDLQAAPYSLVNLASVYATVSATNAIGSSAASLSGNGGAVLPTEPSVPAAPTTTNLRSPSVEITWVAPSDGGSVITGYTVAISDGVTFTAYASCTGTALSCTIANSVLQAAPYRLANGASVYAKIIATNAAGSSAYSVASSAGAVLPTVPSVPSALTSAILGTNVVITWVAPFDGGSGIIGYTVTILKSDDVTFEAYTGCTGTAVSCTIADSVLQAAPYSLANGASVYAKVRAKNAVGDSTAALVPAVALPSAQSKQLLLTDMALNATINETVFLDLPKIDASYTFVVTSRQRFEVSVDGSLLKVLSTNESDIGTKYLDLNATSSSSNVTFRVIVIFIAPSTLNDTTSSKTNFV
jgi:hypothetical protein